MADKVPPGGVRVAEASDKRVKRKASAEPQWMTRAQAAETGAIKKPPTVLERARATGGDGAGEILLAGIMIAQALDRLGARIIQAAALSRGMTGR
jgi:hypothetical protein